MFRHYTRRAPLARAALAALSACAATQAPTAHAQGVASEAELQTVHIVGERSVLDPNLPSSTASVSAEGLRELNLFNPEDAAKLLPSTAIRKRYLGDRNANVSGRSFGSLQPGRALVYVDGYLISNFLGRFDAPRWNMVNVEALERVDALYGPFSAIYPGNSIGTTLVLTERKPRGFEASAALRAAYQDFQEYSQRDRLASGEFSARLAGRDDSGWWWSLGAQRQDSKGHAMGYANAVRGVTGGAFAPPTTGTAVSGVVYDTDPQGRERALFGATGIDHSVQDTLNLRSGLAITPQQAIEARVSLWRSDSQVRASTWLRDAAGAPVWQGAVNDGRYAFTLAPNAFAPSTRQENHRQLGLTWKTTHEKGWNASFVGTNYRIVGDAHAQADVAQPLAEQGGSGSIAHRDGTGWTTLELQAAYRPVEGDWGDGRHALTLGLHRNEYRLISSVYKAADWRGPEGALDQDYSGRTRITALYVQDAWRFADDWRLTAGLRAERFDTWGGAQSFSGVAPVAYAPRRLNAVSPKLSLAWALDDTWLLKASAARGVRFPNVDELYNGTKTGSNITTSDPNLRPERSHALELSAEGTWEALSLRATLFSDDVYDVIVRQTDTTVQPSITRVNNIDRVLTRGLELVWDAQNVGGIKGLAVGGSATYADARVKANAANPATVGMRWARLPPQRYTLQASWRPSSEWLMSAAWRYSGRQYNTDTNLDVNADTYGGTSRVNQLDVKLAWAFAPQWEWSVGIDNLGNRPAWQAHTMPQRVFHTALRWGMR